MERRGPGRAMRKASGPHQVFSIMAPPRRDGCLTPVATAHGPTGQSEDSYQGMALAAVLAEIWDLSQDLDQRTCLWYHRRSSIESVLSRVRTCLARGSFTWVKTLYGSADLSCQLLHRTKTEWPCSYAIHSWQVSFGLPDL